MLVFKLTVVFIAISVRCSECSESLLGVDHSLDSVVHVLNKVDLRATKSALVGDVKDTVVGLGVLSMGTSDIDVVLVGNCLELLLVSAELWQLNVNGGAHASSKVGWAGSNVAEMFVVGELGNLFNLSSGGGESLEDLADVGAWLHGDNSQLILLVHPHEEGLVVIVEDTTSLWPLTLETTALKVLVTSLEEEVVGDELLLLGISHRSKGVVLALKLSIEGGKSSGHLSLNLSPLLSSHGSSEWVVSEVTSDTDSGRVDHAVLISWEVWAVKLSVVHVADVLVRWAMSVISLDDLVEERGEGVVSLVATGVDTNTGGSPLASREDALLEGVAESVSLVLALLPHIAGEGLGKERFGTAWEVGELGNGVGTREVGSHHHSVNLGIA